MAPPWANRTLGDTNLPLRIFIPLVIIAVPFVGLLIYGVVLLCFHRNRGGERFINRFVPHWLHWHSDDEDPPARTFSWPRFQAEERRKAISEMENAEVMFPAKEKERAASVAKGEDVEETMKKVMVWMEEDRPIEPNMAIRVVPKDDDEEEDKTEPFPTLDVDPEAGNQLSGTEPPKARMGEQEETETFPTREVDTEAGDQVSVTKLPKARIGKHGVYKKRQNRRFIRN